MDAVVQRVEASPRLPLGCPPQPSLESSHFVGGHWPAGVVGPALAGHALALTSRSGSTTAGALPSRGVLLHHVPRYYDPLGLPLRNARLHLRLIRAVSPRPGPRRRASPVPLIPFDTCRAPYPGGTCRAFCSGLLRGRFRLRRDMRGSAPPLFLCRGGRLHFMLQPASSLPPVRRLSMPRSGHRDLSLCPGPATRCSGAFWTGFSPAEDVQLAPTPPFSDASASGRTMAKE